MPLKLSKNPTRDSMSIKRKHPLKIKFPKRHV